MTRELGQECNVVAAATYSQALDLLTQRQDICGVISDVSLGTSGLNGIELMRQVQKKRPELARMLLSGFFDKAVAADLVADGVIHLFFDKPWPRGAVLNAAKAWNDFQDYLAGGPGAEKRLIERLRAHPRYRTTRPVRVRYETWGDSLELSTRDVSCGGAFIASSSPPQPNSIVDLELEHPRDGLVLASHLVSGERSLRMRGTTGIFSNCWRR